MKLTDRIPNFSRGNKIQSRQDQILLPDIRGDNAIESNTVHKAPR